MIINAIQNALKRRDDKGWDKTYWAFDIHDTIIEPNWSVEEIPTKFYPVAVDALKLISQREDIVMLLYTCSHPHEIVEYLALFEKHAIYFDYVNENPEVKNGGFGFYDKKPYFNVLFEDKAGFDPLNDWERVFELVNSWDS